ncbi:MAG: hypothetical protein QM791_13665 [Ferruginibacter sp.]
MNKNLPASLLLSVCLLVALMTGCKKGVKDPVTLDKAAGTWSINSIRFNASYGAGATKDSTVPWKPVIGNNVTFDGVSKFDYSFNVDYKSFGTYSLDALSDSMTITFGRDNNRLDGIDYLVKAFGGETTRWKILLLTSTNFNIAKTVNSHNAFPGASSVVIYQSYVR